MRFLKNHSTFIRKCILHAFYFGVQIVSGKYTHSVEIHRFIIELDFEFIEGS